MTKSLSEIENMTCFHIQYTFLPSADILFLDNFCTNQIPEVSRTPNLTNLSLASLLWDIGKQHSPRCDAAERGIPSVAILFAKRNFIEKLNKNKDHSYHP